MILPYLKVMTRLSIKADFKATTKGFVVPDTADSREICKFAAAALGRHDIHHSQFNFVANSNRLSIENKSFFVYAEEAHGVVSASMALLQEYDETKSISRSTRERFILEDTKDRLRLIEPEFSPAAFSALYEKTMATVTSRFTGMESLLFSSSSDTKSKSSSGLKS